MKRVLVVEDDEFLRNAYVMRLKNSTYTFEVATNGKDAMEKMAVFKPNIVVLDLKMPLMDGFEVLEAMSKDRALKRIPTVVASSIGDDRLIEKALDLGARGYIYKEATTLNDIVEILDKFIKHPDEG
jgi:CheY-like chemotaxis protein